MERLRKELKVEKEKHKQLSLAEAGKTVTSTAHNTFNSLYVSSSQRLSDCTPSYRVTVSVPHTI